VGDENDGDKVEAPPHLRMRQNIQKDHPINNILGDIEKGVTTRSRVVNFCEHYSFVFFFWAFQGRRCTTWSGLGGAYARRIE
jgi:hypothetical protein